MNVQRELLNLEKHMCKVSNLDRILIRREMKNIFNYNLKKPKDMADIKNRLSRLRILIKSSIESRERLKKKISNPTYIPNLPITDKKDEIISKIKEHQVLIVEGETGSGKTTQLPKFAIAAGMGIYGKIACTQPRRIAAVSVASRIAEEMGQNLGDLVGYKIRFKEKASKDSCIKVMTDGILLAEVQADPWLNEYDTIIIDEAHERSLNIDFIMGILKNLILRRKSLKLIIASATIDTDKFSKAFNNAPIISVSGRLYPVSVSYLPENINDNSEESISYIEMAVDAVDKICSRSYHGDILVFMPTENDVNEVSEIIIGRQDKKNLVLPLFARLGSKEQKKVFSNSIERKIIVATNVAETSITIPGVKYVVDSGLSRISKYLPQSRITALPILPISRSSADQRKGRCGRIEKGICIRLYSKSNYLARSLFTQPEILRANLAEVILKMIAFNLGNISTFPFIDRPSDRSFVDGFKLLIELGAIVRKKASKKTGIYWEAGRSKGSYGLTCNGKIMSKLPLDPRLSRVLIEASKEGCLKEAVIIVSALNVRDPIKRPVGMEKQVNLAHAVFKDDLSDFVTLLNLWELIYDCKNKHVNISHIKKICNRYFLSFTRIREWIDIHAQVSSIIKQQKFFNYKVLSNKRQNIKKNHNHRKIFSSLYESLHKSILSGFLSNIAVKKDKYFFTASKGRDIMIFPGSSIFNKSPSRWIVATEFVKTSRLFARRVAAIDPSWLETVGGPLCKYSWFDPHWERNMGKVIVYEQVSLFGLIIINARPVGYDKVDPEAANDIFIRRAIVDGDVKRPIPFMDFNKRVIRSVKDMENRIRRRNILVGEDSLVDFYKKRLTGIFDLKTLKRVIKQNGNDNYLRMSETEICSYFPNKKEVLQFPKDICLGNKVFDCSYVFKPGDKQDGLTVTVPADFNNYVKRDRIGWLVPGLFREKITALIKGLNKKYRKKLVPISDTVDLIVEKMPCYKEDILVSLSKFLLKTLNVEIPLKAWSVSKLPDHLKMRISIKGTDNTIVMSSRDEAFLFKTDLKSVVIDPPQEMKERWELKNIDEWNFGDLPEQLLSQNKNGEVHIFYPRLEVVLSNIKIKLFSDFNLAIKMHKCGVAALLSRHFSNDLKFAKKSIKLSKKFQKEVKYFGGFALIESQIYNSLFEKFFELDILTFSEFHKHIKSLSEKKIFIHAEIKRRQVLNVIKLFHKVYNLVSKMERSYSTSGSLYNFSKAIKKDLFRIVPNNFIVLYDSERLNNLVRYISAIQIRLQRGIENIERDKKHAALVMPHILSLEELINDIGITTSDERRSMVEDFFWMIEEYKISVFAQEIKTAIPVSAKRLEKFLEKIKMIS